MSWDEDYEEDYELEDIGDEGEDMLVTIEYIEEKNVEEIDVRNYLNNFIGKMSPSRIQSINY